MRGWLRRARDLLVHAFSTQDSHSGFSAEDEALLDRVARYIVARHMTTPAVLFLESMRPLNFVGSQAMVFLRPILASFFSAQDYERLAAILEKRQSVDALIGRIEQFGPDGQDAATGSCYNAPRPADKSLNTQGRRQH